jgi:hypothetical protein
MKEDRFGKMPLLQLCQRFSLLIAFVALIAWYLKFHYFFPFEALFRESGSRSHGSYFSYALQNYGAN